MFAINTAVMSVLILFLTRLAVIAFDDGHDRTGSALVLLILLVVGVWFTDVWMHAEVAS